MMDHANLKTLAAGFLILAFICCTANLVNLYAQVTGGTISGTVADPSGRVIVGARIAITNPATGISRTVTTNTDGFYTAPNLQAGSYDLTFAAQGFKSEVRNGIALTVGASQVLDLTMRVGTAIETARPH